MPKMISFVDALKCTISVARNGRGVMITRVFDVSRHLLFKAWTESEHLMSWRGPEAEKPGEMIQ